MELKIRHQKINNVIGNRLELKEMVLEATDKPSVICEVPDPLSRQTESARKVLIRSISIDRKAVKFKRLKGTEMKRPSMDFWISFVDVVKTDVFLV